MSSVEKLEGEVEIKSPAEKFHNAYNFKPHHINKMSPNLILAVDLIEGEFGKKGCVLNWIFTQDGEKKESKEQIEEIDDEKYSATYKVVGGELLKYYKQFGLVVKATPKGEGSVVHWIFDYEKLNPEIPNPDGLLDFLIQMTKDMDGYIEKIDLVELK